MAILFEGDVKGKAVDVEVGADKNGKPRVRWNMLVTEGPHSGKKASYSGKLDPENIKWTKRDMIAIGWQGRDVRTFVADVAAADRTLPFVAEIASFERDGKVSQWTSARSIGFAAAPLSPLAKDKVADVNSWFADAGEIGGGGGGNDGVPF